MLLIKGGEIIDDLALFHLLIIVFEPILQLSATLEVIYVSVGAIPNPSRRWNWLRKFTGPYRRDDWNIGVVYKPIDALLRASLFELQIHWLPASERGKFLADPFGVVRDQRLYIVCEEFDYSTNKGRIVCIEFEGSNSSTRKVAIEFPFHTSYPYLVEYQGEIYCVPETHEAREIRIYKAEEFPTNWTKTGTLIENFAGLDPTVFQYQGRWWLTSVEHNNSLDKLYLWQAPALFGPWKPHPSNPIKTNRSSSRPAGTPFTHGGYLYRPSQDSTRTYGGRIMINRVLKLTPTEFTEELAAIVEPNPNGPYPDGLHTISAVGNLTLFDSKRFPFGKKLYYRLFKRSWSS